MLEFKQSTQIRVPVRLLTSFGVPVALVPYTGVTVTIEKADGTTYAFVPTNVQWVEITTGAFLNQGKYDLIIPNTFTDQVGPFSVAVAANTANTFVGLFKIISYESLDVFNEAALAASATSLTSFQSDFDTWKTDWTTVRAVKIDTIDTNVTSISTQTTLLLSFTRGTWTIFDSGIDSNKMVFYDEVGVVLAKFNLQDDAGHPVSTNPFTRIRIPGSGYGA